VDAAGTGAEGDGALEPHAPILAGAGAELFAPAPRGYDRGDPAIEEELMGSDVVLWAGKRLTDEEAAATRRAVALLRRLGDEEDALHLARFLPEAEHDWSPDELEMGAHGGPWMGLDAGVEGRA
jgi:hypothetical protein